MMTDEEFRLFRNLVYEASGICFRESRMEFLENRLSRRMKAKGMNSFYWYYRLVSEKNNPELPVMLDILTINETSFFRNRPQMDFFRYEVLPEVIKRQNRSKVLRIWSAGCSTGEEPYSIAMFVLDSLPDHHIWDITIFASDLSLTALEKANRGEYEKEKVNGTADIGYIAKYFEDRNDCYSVKDSVRKLVVFDYHNLKNENGIGDLDIIFCRNVMIYFDLEEQKRMVDKFHRSLRPGGFFFVGHAESLQGLHQGFRFISHNSGTAYRKAESTVSS
jgi:chemotaxis protein methyltransferase CheR